VHDLFEFNDEASAEDPRFYFSRPSMSKKKCPEVRPLDIENWGEEIEGKEKRKPRKFLIEILCWCLMRNHFHLLVRQLKDGGAVRFMQKLGTGYSMFFNQKYERNGTLFQGRFKAVHVVRDEHLTYLPFYIHANPLDNLEPEWRKGKIKNLEKIENFLKTFRWSSHLDFSGKKNFPSVSQRDFFGDIYGGEEKYRALFKKWLTEMNLEETEEILLE